ncbi:MAG: 4'-phosphopantetheinyl transferase superfamily protein [Burkholderiaceae bacterium]|nr:4'-phosphopantetheinyl transferase superfamily protein [Burkholderiaceae bacterium]
MSVSVLITSEFIPSPMMEAEWLAGLPTLRRAELARWPDHRARRLSLLGSRLLAAGLVRLGFCADGLSSLRYLPQSRPTVDLPVDFSLSHCEGRIVCALSTSGRVGIDVERLGDLTAGDFPLYLSAAERAWAGTSAQRFYSVWTRKEAVAKAAGSGGLRDVARVDTSMAEHRAALAGRLWHTPPVPVGRAHIAHLALEDEPCELTVRYISSRELEHKARLPECGTGVAPFRAVL